VKAYNKLVKEEPVDEDDEPAPGAASSQTTAAPVPPGASSQTIAPAPTIDNIHSHQLQTQGDPLAASIAFWVQHNLGYSAEAKHRIAQLFYRAGFDPAIHFTKATPTQTTNKGIWTRCLCNPETMQLPTATTTHPDPYRHVGGHATSTSGVIGILTERRVTKRFHAGVYCQGHNDVKTFEDTKWIVEKAMASGKNVSDVIFEIHATGETVSLGGGVEAEAVPLREGKCMHSTTYKRWAFPEELVLLRAVWFSENSVLDIARVDIQEI
jgi:hypothetical protein